MALDVEEAREQQTKVYFRLGILGAVVFVGLMTWNALKAPRFGEPCEEDCLTGQCLREKRMVGNIPMAGAAYCTRTCKGPDDCGAGYVCGEAVEVKHAENTPVIFVDTKDGAPVHACLKRR